MKKIFAIFLCLFAMPAMAQDKAAIEQQFQSWLSGTIAPAAQKRGVDAATFKAATNGLRLNWKLPDLVPPGSKQTAPKTNMQAEFRSPANYFSEKTIGNLVSGGRARADRYKSVLGQIERKYGVPGHFILAIWGRESGFGGAKIPHNVFDVLATKGFMSTRTELFTEELLSALEITAKGYATTDQMKSSWAGALGQPQFLPSSYLQYAVDFDGDGKRNIWTSVPDTLASIANYLAQKGWQRGRDWGFEIALPPTLNCAVEGPDRRKSISAWENDGIIRVTGRAFTANERGLDASVLLPAGRYGPEFLVTPNFYVFKEYNESDLYALFVGHVGDRIAYGNNRFIGNWRSIYGLFRSDIAAMQNGLVKQGYDVGGADGLPGFKTRRSIGDWHARNNIKPSCFPSAELVRALK